MTQGGVRGLRAGIVFGPGLVYFLSSFGSSDIFLNSVVGATYGYSLLWTLIPVAVAQYVVLETSSRYVVVTGESVLTGICRRGHWLAWFFLVTFFVRRHLGNLVHIVLVGNAFHFIVPLPTPASERLWSIVFLALSMVVVIRGRYRGLEKSMKPLFGLLAGSFLVIGLFSKPDPGAVVWGLFVPSLPVEQGAIRYSLLLMALLGSGSASIAILKYSAFVQEKEWDRLAYLKRQRRDLLLSVACILASGVILQAISAGSALSFPDSIGGVQDLVPAFSEKFGAVGRLAFAATVWSASLTTFLGANSGYGLLVADILHNIIPGFRGRKRRSSHELASTAAFRWSVLIFFLSPVYVLLTSWKPVPLVIVSSCFMLLLLPLMGVYLLLLTNDRSKMGGHVSGPVTNGLLGLTILVALYVTWVNAIEFWEEMTGLV